MTLRLTLIASAATAATRRASFPLDEELETVARTQATAMAGTLGRVDRAWTSPARRAQETAVAMGLAADVEPALADLGLGEWAGRTLIEVEATDAVGLQVWMERNDANPHGGETITAVLERTARWLESLTHQEGRVVAVTHPAIMRAALLNVLEANPRQFWRIDISPLTLVRLQARSGRWTYCP